MHTLVARTLILASVVLLASCASTQDFGEQVSAEGKTLQELGDRWQEGRSLSIKGEKLVAEGRKQAEKGRAKIREGEALAAEGNALVRANREAYVRQSELSGLAESPRDVAKEAKALDEISEDWDDGLDLVKKGEKRVAEGNKLLHRAEKQISDGQSMMERGQTLMQTSEEAYQKRKEAARED